MKVLKKVIFFGVFILTTLFIPNIVRAEVYENLNYETVSSGLEIAITGVVNKDVTEVNIPDEINGCAVRYIKEEAFYQCENLTSIKLPEHLLSIGKHAFSGCDALTGISIPPEVWNIEEYAFSGCSSLSKVNIQGNLLQAIKTGTFEGCNKLENLELREDSLIQVIEEEAFYWSGLKNINIPYAVEVIEKGAFARTNLTNITAKNNTRFIVEDGVLYNKNKTELIVYPCGNQRKQYTVPETVITIDSNAFEGNKYLESIVISKNVKDIGLNTFAFSQNLKNISIAEGSLEKIPKYMCYICKNLTSVNMPKTVKTIGAMAFYDCEKLKNVNLIEGLEKIEDGAFMNCQSIEKVKIPSTIKNIEEDVFAGCTSLKNVEILTNKLTEISEGMFSGCKSLTKFIFPKGITSIGKYAFNGCNSLENVNFPQGLKSIKECAFQYCTSFTYVNIPDGVTEVGNKAFHYCNSLEYIRMPKSATNLGFNIFQASYYIYPPFIISKNYKLQDEYFMHPVIYEEDTKLTKYKIKTIKNQVYSGKNITPKVIVEGAIYYNQNNNSNFKKQISVEYDVKYSNNKSVGTATVTLTGKGIFTGKLTKTFKIIPKGTSVSKVTAKSKSFKVKWKAQKTQTTGYEIQYSTNKKFKSGNKTVKVKKNKTTSTTVKKLKAKKKYYVRIRTYKTVNGKTYYSGWSKVKNVTTKK